MPYRPVDQPDVARELFIRHALVLRRVAHPAPVLRDQPRLLEEAEELEHRARRRDIVVDEETLFDFYDARVGAEVVSGAHFDTWWKQERRDRPDLLTFDPAMLVHETADEVARGRLPGRLAARAPLTLPLSYHFEPGAAADGRHHRRAARDAQPGRRRAVHLERARPARTSWSPR